MKVVREYQGFASLYDELMDDAPYEEWFVYLRSSIQTYKPESSRLLDLGCGTGRIAIRMAKEGYHVTGVDLSEEMLAIAYSRSMESGAQVEWVHQDMRDLQVPTSFDCIYSFCDSLNYLLTVEDLRKTFMNVSHHLEKDGLFLFDVHTPYKITDIFLNAPFVQDDEEIAYIWQTEVDVETYTVDHTLHFFVLQESGLYQRFMESHRQRAYPMEQLESMLKECGFSILEITADFQKSAPEKNSERYFFIAQKK